MTIFQDVETRGLEAREVIPYVDDGKDRLTHIINQADNTHIWVPPMTTQDIVDTARMLGEYVIALCGYKWVPLHDPEKYPVCETCINIANKIIELEDGS